MIVSFHYAFPVCPNVKAGYLIGEVFCLSHSHSLNSSLLPLYQGDITIYVPHVIIDQVDLPNTEILAYAFHPTASHGSETFVVVNDRSVFRYRIFPVHT